MSRSEPNQDAEGAPALLRAAVLVLLAVATVAALFLVRSHFGAHPPGCGGDSDCAALEASRWGKLPGIGWPTSFLGLSWFLGLLVAFAVSRGAATPLLRALALLGAAGSVLLVGVMISMQKFCPYCAAAHAANLALAVLLLLTRRRMNLMTIPARRLPLVAGIAAFALSTAGLAFAESQRVAALAEGARQEAVAFVAQATKKAAEPSKPVDRWGAAGFTGRNHHGPDLASVRIVMFTDYQCPDCKSFEAEADRILAAHPEVSLSVKHFPMCMDCNKDVPKTLHPNACNAARAAEAAAILGGDEAFYKMHRWLFGVDGRFETTAQLDAGIVAAGLEPVAFRAVMNGPETLRRVQADAAEAIALGLFYTPMIFINGTELKWSYDAAATLTGAVDALLAKKLTPADASGDRPPLAAAKYVDDWKGQKLLSFAADQPAWAQPLGQGAGKPVDILMFGDYASPFTLELDTEIRRAAAAAGVMARFTYRHYPVNRECNATLPRNLAPGIERPAACRMARAAEAAGRVGGAASYWKMHEWLLSNQTAFSDAAVAAQAARIGLDAAAFKAAMDASEAASAIANDCEAARAAGLKSVPTIYVAGRRVPRPKLAGADVMSEILRRAAQPN